MLKKIFNLKMFVTFFMGMASGLPLLLTLSTLQAWMKDSQVDLTQIGLITLVGLPYSWKFVWAPIFDRYTLFFLGRRRGWLLVTQIGLMVTIALMSLLNPLNQITLLVIAAAGVAFLSASQDIVIDSYRREILNDDELGLGSSVYVYGYRTAMLISGAGSLIIADKFSWSTAYLFMALLFIPAILCTILAPEPKVESKPPQNFKETVVEPFVEFFKRNQSILILLFILLYKLFRIFPILISP